MNLKWKNNERFADIFNAYLFQGEQIIKSEDLTEADTDISSLIKFNGHKNIKIIRQHMNFYQNFKRLIDYIQLLRFVYIMGRMNGMGLVL